MTAQEKETLLAELQAELAGLNNQLKINAKHLLGQKKMSNELFQELKKDEADIKNDIKEVEYEIEMLKNETVK